MKGVFYDNSRIKECKENTSCIKLSRLWVFLINFGVFGKNIMLKKILFFGKSDWYSSYNSFQLYDCNHQVCHRWRFLTNDVRLWKDKIAALGKLVSCVIFIGSSPKGPTNQVLLPNLCYRNKVTKRHILLQHCTCILRYTSSYHLYSCLLVENIHAHLTGDSWIFHGGGGSQKPNVLAEYLQY